MDALHILQYEAGIIPELSVEQEIWVVGKENGILDGRLKQIKIGHFDHIYKKKMVNTPYFER